MPLKQKFKFLAFCAFEDHISCGHFVALISGILWQRAHVTVFENFLQKKERFEKKRFMTFIDSPQGMCERV